MALLSILSVIHTVIITFTSGNNGHRLKSLRVNKRLDFSTVHLRTNLFLGEN